jgi:hypothetical protein
MGRLRRNRLKTFTEGGGTSLALPLSARSDTEVAEGHGTAAAGHFNLLP